MSFLDWKASKKALVVPEVNFALRRPAPKVEVVAPELPKGEEEPSYEDELQAAVYAQLSGDDDDDEERPVHYSQATRGVMTRVMKPGVKEELRAIAAGLRGASGRNDE